MKPKTRKLSLCRDTLRVLAVTELRRAAAGVESGGTEARPCTVAALAVADVAAVTANTCAD